jgi:lysophospholipase L1-like esterase
MNLRYLLGIPIALPLLPLMYVQGKRIRQEVPKLPEAKEPQGSAGAEFPGALKMIAIGESTIAGIGVDRHGDGFNGSLANELAKKLQRRIDWRVYAKSGYTARKVRKILLPKIEEKEVDLIVIGLGGNDAFTLNRPQNWRQEIEKLIKDLQHRFPEASIFFTNMPPIKEFPAFTSTIKMVVGNLGEILGEELEKVVAGFQNVYFSSEKIAVDTWSDRYGQPGEGISYFSDGVHPSQYTYQVWARDMASFIANNY